ncbi:hypothetical protein H5410_045891 [Solanum commersonii]|uniref:Uncharacterized protein n=1 Tax=Solanum commersonii TaxID=4109 RepID=A0A9J5XAS6_SOLCO|nr:hypothetical protein H5410_045891 [Solanum commersonii]
MGKSSWGVTAIQVEINRWFSNICAATDHSATLVRIADQLDNSPFGVALRRLAPSFGIIVLWVIRRYSTALWNFLAMRQLDPFL